MIDKFDGTPYAFLSNFYPCRIFYDGATYSCSENAFQATKTTDKSLRAPFSGEVSPYVTKKMGRKLVLRPDWEKIKDSVMYEILKIKFSIPDLREKLLATGDEELVEGNTWGDHYWGFCDGYGKNMLGKTLMRVRDEIRKTK